MTLQKVVLIVMVHVGVCLGAPSIQLNIKDLPQYGLSLVPSIDPSFVARVQILLSNAVDPAVGLVMPFSAILQNQSGADVVGFSMRWIWTDTAGRTTTHDVFYHNLNTPTVSAYRLPSGSAAFVSPYFAFVKYNSPKRLSSTQLNNLARMQTQAAITISLDGVVFSDGRYVGPDEVGGFSEALAVTQGEKALMGEILSRRASGQRDDDIFQYVAQLAAPSPPIHFNLSALDWPMFHRQDTAHMLLRIYQQFGSAKAYAVASARIAATDLALTKVNFNGN